MKKFEFVFSSICMPVKTGIQSGADGEMMQTLDSGVRRNNDKESQFRVERGSVLHSILRRE
jgi:hypothetical protein